MRTSDAAVRAIWRYPLKSMLGEELDVATINERGLAGDRAYALIDAETGKVVSAKNPRRWQQMFGCRAEYLESPDPTGDVPTGDVPTGDVAPIRITMPDGTAVRS